jgi:hypothetical protein
VSGEDLSSLPVHSQHSSVVQETFERTAAVEEVHADLCGLVKDKGVDLGELAAAGTEAAVAIVPDLVIVVLALDCTHSSCYHHLAYSPAVRNTHLVVDGEGVAVASHLAYPELASSLSACEFDSSVQEGEERRSSLSETVLEEGQHRKYSKMPPLFHNSRRVRTD